MDNTMRVAPESRRSIWQQLMRRRFALAAVILCAAMLFRFVLSGGVTRWIAGSAQQAILKRNFPLAERHISNLQRIAPRSADAAFLRAEIARLTGNSVAASELRRLASRRGFDSQRLNQEQILADVQHGDVDRHESQLKQWLLDSTVPAALVCDAYANGLAALSRFDEAVVILDAWHLDYPGDPLPLFRLGRIQEHLVDQELASELYRKAIATEEQFLPAHYALARILLENKQADAAQAHFQACWISDDDAAAITGVAQCLIAQGEQEKAIELLQRVVRMMPQIILRSYQRLEENPERFIAAAELGKLETQLGNFEPALLHLNAALKFNSRDTIARYSRAIALRGLGRIEEAESELEKVQETKSQLAKVNPLRNEINRDPNNLELRIALGKLLIEYESERNGLFWIRSALAHDPHYQPAHRVLADYFQHRADKRPGYADLAEQHRQQLDTETEDAQNTNASLGE